MEERNKKLAKFAGNFDFTPNGRYEAPDGEWDLDFLNDLNACFKYLMPEVRKKLTSLELGTFFHDWAIELWYDAEPAISLCLAIERLMVGRKDES